MSVTRNCIPCEETVVHCEYKLCSTIVYLGGRSDNGVENAMYNYPNNTKLVSMPSPPVLNYSFASNNNNNTRRIDFKCVYLKGLIYVFGGSRYCDSKNGCLPNGANEVISSMITYNIWNNTWDENLPSMNTARRNFASAVLNGTIFAIGGMTNNSEFIDAVEIYIPGNQFWKNDTFLPFSLAYSSAVVLDQSLYVIGGRSKINGTNALFQTLLLYETNRWKIMAPMNSNRFGASSTVYRDNIYVMGGSTCSSAFVTFTNSNYSVCTQVAAIPTMEVYARNLTTWSIISFGNATSTVSANLTLLPVTQLTSVRGRYEGVLIALGDSLYAMGGSPLSGCNFNRLKSVFKYNVLENNWILNNTDLVNGLCGLGAVVIDTITTEITPTTVTTSTFTAVTTPITASTTIVMPTTAPFLATTTSTSITTTSSDDGSGDTTFFSTTTSNQITT